MFILLALGGVGVAAALIILSAIMLRRVVPPNAVHIVQSAKTTKSYGKDTPNGNVYYEWPAWIPAIGVTKTVLPVSVFDVNLKDYDSYDMDRVPFIVDITAFFRIEDTNCAAQRVSSFQELHAQLVSILKGAVRTVLAGYTIDDIMTKRSAFGDQFTHEVTEQLKNWGVTPVKNIELMDIRDTHNSNVIENIMAKRISEIEMESRTAVANNERAARVAEIEATQAQEMRDQEAQEAVGKRVALKNQAVGITTEQSKQRVAEEQKNTKVLEMAVKQVEQVKSSEIAKEVAIVAAKQSQETSIITATAKRDTDILFAEGELEQQKREAMGIQAKGAAEAEAKKLMELAPIQAQIELAKEIGENHSYQEYLISIRNVEMTEKVGIEQARTLAQADIKIIANGGDVNSGLKSIGDLFSSKGGTAIGSLLEGLANTTQGKALVDKVVSEDDKPDYTIKKQGK